MRKGKTVYHCHGRNKGKPIKTHKTVPRARAQHRAIMANKKKDK